MLMIKLKKIKTKLLLHSLKNTTLLQEDYLMVKFKILIYLLKKCQMKEAILKLIVFFKEKMMNLLVLKVVVMERKKNNLLAFIEKRNRFLKS